MLEQERKYFEAHQAEWAITHPGKLVLVRGEGLVGTFDDAENAVSEGMKQFGLGPFLVRQVNETDEVVTIPALMFGLLNGCP